KLQIENLRKNKDKNFTFNIKEWNEFIKDLNFCSENGLSSKDKKAIKCIKYWKENILEENKVSDEMIKFAEEYYQKDSTNTFGMTEENYKYLVGVINEYDKKSIGSLSRLEGRGILRKSSISFFIFQIHDLFKVSKG